MQPTKTIPQERRSYRRAELVAPVRIHTPSGDRNGEVRDVSTGGLGVANVGGFDVGERVRVDFDVDQSTVQVDAEVAWTNGTRAGLRFCSLDAEALRTLAHYVAG